VEDQEFEKEGRGCHFLGKKWQPAEGDKSIDKGIYSKLPVKRRGKKEGLNVALRFVSAHLCAPYINTQKV
jgi:hypothetical protein